MNYDIACNILNINKNNINHNNIKQNYYKEALKYHPDKYNDNGEKFKEIKEAYEYLLKYTNNTKHINNNIGYKHLIKSFIDNILNNYSQISIKLFNKIDNDIAIDIYIYLLNHNDIFNIDNKTLNKFKSIIQNKIKNYTIIKLTPNIHNLLNDDICIYNINNNDIYIPLWHHELHYDISNTNLIIICEPNINKDLFIDNKNNLYVNYTKNINEILNKNKFDIVLANKTFNIDITKLKITTDIQTYMIKNKGILYINEHNYLDDNRRSDIIFRIKLTP